MLELDITTIVLEIVNFLVLTALLYHYLFKPVMQRVRERAQEKKRLMKEMQENRDEAARLKEKLEERLAHADEEVAEIFAQAQEQMEAEQKAVLQAVQEEAERILKEAQSEAQRLQEQAMNDFHDELLDTVVEISGQVISQIAPQEAHDALVKQLNDRIWELGRNEMRQVENIRRSLGERSPTVHAQTARSLSPDQQRQLVRTFSALADRNVNLELKTDPSLAVGMRVHMGDIIVDNSIAAQLTELREEISEELKEQMSNE